MPLLTLFAQSVAMFAASFGIGYLPLAFKSVMSGKPLKAISVFGMGLLVGAALTIIIPEGVDTLYDSLPANKEGLGNTSMTIGVSLLSGFALMLLVESLTPHPGHAPEMDVHVTPPYSPIDAERGLPDGQEEEQAHPEVFADEDGRPGYTPGPNKSAPEALRMDSRTTLFPCRLANSKDRRYSRTSLGPAASTHCPTEDDGASRSGLAGLNATLGLIIHAMADGIALGSSSLSSSGGLGLVVFIAVIVHKGPTALGLTTTLLSLKLTPPQIRKRLLLFSLSAPTGAILTYMIVYMFGGGRHKAADGEFDRLGWSTAVALLFSGGSFLYVATVVQPLSDLDSHITHAHAHTHEAESETLGKWSRLGLLGIGMVLPLILGVLIGGHGH